jgi:hypothetical protein
VAAAGRKTGRCFLLPARFPSVMLGRLGAALKKEAPLFKS